jgi:hypothetical protein
MAQDQTTVQVNIESLQLNGFSERDAMRFEYGFRSELSVLATASGELSGANHESIEGSVKGSNAESIGRSVAHTIYGGISHE